MDLIRSIVLANVCLLVLVYAATDSYRRKVPRCPPVRKNFVRCPRKFKINFGAAFGKRNNYFPGFGERTQVLQTGNVQEPAKQEKFYSEKEPQRPYLNTDYGILPDSKVTMDYFYSDYLPQSRRKLEQVQRYAHPENGYILSNSRIWGKSTRLHNGPEERMSEAHVKQNPSSDGTMELVLFLKKLLSRRDLQ